MNVRLKPLLPAWLGGAANDAGTADVTAAARRRLWLEIEDLLSAHELEPSPANFEAAHAYVTGDPAARAAIGAALGDGGLNAAAMDAIVAARESRGVAPAALAQVAEKLEDRLGEVLRIVGLQAASARDYGDALDHEARSAADDPAGAFDRLIAMTRDVVAATRAMEGRLDQARREAEVLRSDLTSARRAADRDHLTGLPNRRFFDARLAEQPNGCLALCDIDDFKRINDAHGHETGDRVLRFVARALKRELAGQALVARYGGEEFACLFDHDDLARAQAALDRIRDRLRDRSLVDRTSGTAIGRLTFSAGLTPVAGQARAALRAADNALYTAKRSGKDRVEIAPQA